MAPDRCSSAKFQIQAAPSPSTTRRSVCAKPRRWSSRSTRAANADGGAVGVAAGDALDGAIAGHGARVATGHALPLAPLGRPDRDQLNLAGLGTGVELVSDAAYRFALTHRNAGAVEPDVERACRTGLGLDDLAFVARDVAPQRLNVALHLLGAHLRGRPVRAASCWRARSSSLRLRCPPCAAPPTTATRRQSPAPGRAD